MLKPTFSYFSDSPVGKLNRILATTLGLTILTACANNSTPTEPSVPLVSMPQIASVPVPDSLTMVTGISWDEASEQFVVVTDSGQIAAIDGVTFELSGAVDSGVPSLIDITVGSSGILAITSSGERIQIVVDESGQPSVSGIASTALDFEVSGVAIHPLLSVPVVSRDSATGPALWLIEESGSSMALQLSDDTLTATSSLVLFGPTPLVSDATAPTIIRFAEDGTPDLRLQAQGLQSIEGVTNRDGTLILTGLAEDGIQTFAAYDVQNDEEINPDPNAGPAQLASVLVPESTIELPDSIKQPSGIAYDPMSDSIVLNTDQAEFYALAPDLSAIRYSFDVPGFSQGAVEDVQVVGPGDALVVAESGDMVPFTFDGTTWSPGPLVTAVAVDVEVSAIGHDPVSDELIYIAGTGPEKELIVTTRSGEFVERRKIDTQAIGIDNLDEYTVAGISYSEGVFYVLSEQYSRVFTMTPAGIVTGAYGLSDAVEPTGITVHDNLLWVVFDHEDSAPTPPMARYLLPTTP